MNILSIQKNQVNNTFTANSHFVKKELIQQNVIKKDLKAQELKKLDKIAKLIASGISPVFFIDSLLKEKGITYFEANNKTINFACGQDGGFYQIEADYNFTNNQAKEYIFRLMTDETIGLGGFENYYKMLKDIGRQDIVQKGLKIHTYKLDIDTPIREKFIASMNLSAFTKQNIMYNDLFMVDSDAFYYDKQSKTAYCVRLNDSQSDTIIPVYRVCKFITNLNGKTIGFNVTDWNIYHGKNIETKYLEQQEPSMNLPSVVSPKEQKEFAEAYRFGNTEPNSKIAEGISNVIKHLSKKANIQAKSNDLQFIKFSDKDGNIMQRIGYYNPATGTSIIYNQDGKYMYQMEYNKDKSGNITDCIRI